MSIEASYILGDNLHDDGGVERGGKLSEIRWIFPELTMKWPIYCISLLVDFIPLLFSSF
jgi:hypothetical protein